MLRRMRKDVKFLLSLILIYAKEVKCNYFKGIGVINYWNYKLKM
ncbi:hypothetical protein NF27_EY00800 [Candidatus Jidaibacter acanthamoeba]|uniref:Uncharacterized protein n=1 Tax=Candidatus Jidaibacter acanthamoebae TaxID=86105 RepID=A0A0C1QHK5_9RICK|nr:hypothetical protein NF27_EY00800 [Candidatus Jidaibacter acanthamoeba]